MATLVLSDAFILINAVNLSTEGNNVTVNYGADVQEDTAFGDTSRSRLGGLKDWSMEMDFNQNFAAGSVDATLFGIVGTTIAVEVRPTSAARSATNPAYTGNAVVETYNPLGNAVGEKAAARVVLRGSGTLTRAVV